MEDVKVYSKPTRVEIRCEKCLEDTAIDYKEFTEEHGEPCQWVGELVKCHSCGYVNMIGGWDFE